MRKYHYPEYQKAWGEKNKEKLAAYCKKWHTKNPKYLTEYYLKNREAIRTRERENRLKKKIACFEKYGAGTVACACCGEKEIKFLSIDHINGGGSAQKKKLGGGGDKIYRWLIKNDFPAGFQVLCHNCNQAKGAYGACPHKI